MRVEEQLEEQRRAALSQHDTLTGIDFVKFIPPENEESLSFALEVYFIPKVDQNAIRIPNSIQASNILIRESISLNTAGFVFDPDPDEAILPYDQVSEKIVINLKVNDAADFKKTTKYILTLINVPNVDSFFNEVEFFLQADPPSGFDCQTTSAVEDILASAPEIDYLTKDYESFRGLMLDRLSTLIPEWQENNPADIGTVLVEALAYAADQLSYYQDAVATEAYLGTARRRVSVKRHARLLDYNMHEGVNSRVWVHIPIESGSVDLKEKTILFTRTPGLPNRVLENNFKMLQLPSATEVFETLYPVKLYAELNEMPFYTWGSEAFHLEKGATKATLKGHFNNLKVGDVLVFENLTSTDPTKRHVVRLTKVLQSQDTLGGRFQDEPNDEPQDITEIEWHSEDALPFCFCVTKIEENQGIQEIGRARGNMVLADYGRTYKDELLEPNIVPAEGQYRPRLKRQDITFKSTFDPIAAEQEPASSVLLQDPRLSNAVIELKQGKETWNIRPDLLSSNRFNQDFVVEIDNNRRAFIRFGDSNFGKRPSAGVEFKVSYRIGNGTKGNIGAEALTHIVSDESLINDKGIRNPLPARGGVDPEPIEQVQRDAPQAFQRQQRAVTIEDYVRLTEAHPEVNRAAALRHWTGSWYTFFIAVDREGGLSVDDTFKQNLKTYLAKFKLLNHDIEVIPPHFVALEIALVVRVKNGFLPNVVRQSLVERFSNKILPNGERGFFHPDNFSFGDTIYLSRIITEAVAIPGVSSIDINSPKRRFQRLDRTSDDSLEEDFIQLGALEIAQVLNDPAAPEKGRIQFFTESEL